MTSRKIQYWVIPPAANGEFVACMENVLAWIFHKPSCCTYESESSP